MPEKKQSNVDAWLKEEDDHTREALEAASRHFDKNDALTVNTLEAIYGKESSFGSDRRSRNISGAAGDFQIEKNTAKRMGLTVSKENDQRFDVDDASAAAAKYAKKVDNFFSKETTLVKGLKTIPVTNPSERKKFTIAAYNAGEGRIAKAQAEAKKAGKDPQKWKDVEQYLAAAGATEDKAKEIREYVKKVLEYEKEFSEKSKADKEEKQKEPKPIKRQSGKGHWVTIKGKQVFIED